MSINIALPTKEGTRNAVVALPVAGIVPLREAVKQCLGDELPSQSFTLTDTLKDITNDEDVRQLLDGATLVVTNVKDGQLAAPARERISFQPHPKTLTMAGDYEYFAAQGRHPFVYALAEFIDNSLRATRKNAPNPRNITISLLTTGTGAAKKGLVCIQDNGCGMTKHELKDWAVMNYSMEERGAKPQEPEVEGRGGVPANAAGRFLTGDLSFFGVGSKNAAFFMGSSVKIATRKAGERFIHELSLDAADLESRYRNHEAVYEEDMVHRNPGDVSTISKMESPFNASSTNWIQEEAGNNDSFTRVIIGDLKPDILQQLAEDAGGAQISRELAHVYHYYLHGEAGNKLHEEGVAAPTVLPNGEPLPNIVLRHALDSRVLWERKLTDVDDDLETRMLRANKSEFTFTLEVPEKGIVNGVLYYFPYENDRETVPLEAGPSWAVAARHSGAGATQIGMHTQAGGANGRTQLPAAGTTQFGGATAAGGGASGSREVSQNDLSDDEDAHALPQRSSIFSAFWQGRLIPSAQVDSLPFLDAIRSKRTAAVKDALPDEVFGRLRGALFFGPEFRVTRNKLLFRDNLPEVLSTSVPGDRNIEKRFKDWLSRCHSTLDKSFRFTNPIANREQAVLRARLGEGITAFERISDGNRTVTAGDAVRLSAKPAVVGRVLYFTVPQVVRDDGAYSNGRVHVEPLPKGIHGANGPIKDFSLRRLDTVLTEKDTEEFCTKEMAKLPMSLRVEPMRFATGQAVEMIAGDLVPETSIAVLNGSGQKLVRAFYNGEKQALMVTQKLWRVPYEGAALPSDGAAGGDAAGADGENQEKENAEGEATERPAKRSRKGRKGKKQQEEETQAAAAAAESSVAGSSSPAELIFSAENKTPYKGDTFIFQPISDGLIRAGHYVLEYFLTPVVDGQPPLRCTVPLVVGPGAATCIKVAGEGAAAVASRAMVLGETMPPFTLLFCDEFGNEVAMPKTAESTIKVQAMVLGSDGETFEKCKGLTVNGEIESDETSAILRNLRFIGSKKAAAAGTGLPVFLKQAEELGSNGGAAGQRGASQNAIIPVAVHACFSVAGSAIDPKHVEVQLHPGAPHALQLLPGGFWEQENATATVQSGAELPEFTVKAVDFWGNPTAPTEKMQFSLVVDSEALLGAPLSFSFDAAGVATVSGLRAATRKSGTSSVRLSLKCTATAEALETAVEMAQPAKDLVLPMQVLPSALPAYAQITVDGEMLPMEDRPDDDGLMVPTAILRGVEAGSSKGGLRLVLLDEAGAPAALPVTGRIHVSWHAGSKKITWKGEPIKLPAIRAPEQVSEPMSGFVRFIGEPSNPLTIDCLIELVPIPGPPCSWSVTLVDQVNSQSPEQQGFIVSGQPFAVEIEALDKHTNRCPRSDGAGAIPEPEITLDSVMPLEYNPEEWERGWVAQGNEEVYNIRMTVGGHPGEVKIKVCDSAASDKSSLLQEDCLTVDLRAGPPAALAFEGAASIDCGTRAVLGNVEVVLRDAAGYPTKSSETFEVTLAGSALASDGSGRAAKVVASNANKAKITKGKSSAVFKGVVITADEPGTYALRVQSASRKVALQEGVLRLVMAPITAVTGLAVQVPPELSEGGQVGVTNRLLVAAETENGELLPEDAAAAGLTLKITPPGGNRNDITVCNLPTPTEEGEGYSLPIENGCYSFALPELTQAGTWTAAAEYTESRADVRAALGKKADIRSSAVQFSILPGPPVTAVVEAPQLPDRATVTNASAAKARLLVRNAATQVQDTYGNAAEAEGVQLRFRLRAIANTSMPPGSVIPTLEAEEGVDTPKQLDDCGRAYFGKLSIVEGTGAAPNGPLELELICEALGLYPSSDAELEMDEEGWTVCWKCPVVFSDNAAQFGAVERLNEQRGALLERREDVQRRLDEARNALSMAQKQDKRAEQAAEAVQKRVAGELPSTVKAAERQLKKLEKSAEAAGGEPEEARRAARWGPERSPLTASINMALRANTSGLIGVFAQLITVDDDRLATVASAALRPNLGVLVVEDNNSRTTLAAALTAKKFPMPDVLPLTQVNVFRGPKQGEIPGFNGAGELAKVLTRSACAGTDRALCLPLPHQKVNNKDGAGGSKSMNWPQGCLGYLCNLVRPVHPGHRSTIIFGLLSGTLIFETLDDATAYREYVTQTMKMPFGNEMLCLDGGRVTGRGIISGSNFRPPPLDKADFVIGSGEAAPGGGSADKIQGLQSWIEVLQEKEAAEASVKAAEKEIETAERSCRPELDAVDGELADVDAQIAQLQTNGGGLSHQKQQKGGGKQQRKRQHEEVDDGAEIEIEEEQVEPKAKAKRKRLVKGG